MKQPGAVSMKVGALVGALATAGLIGWLFLAHQWLALPFVPLDVTDFIIRLTPGAIATAGIETLGVWAQRSLKVLGLVIVLGAGAVLGTGALSNPLRARPRWLRSAVLAAGSLLATVIVESVLDWNRAPQVTSLVGLAASYLVWAWVINWGLDSLGRATATAAASEVPSSAERRAFLVRFGLATLGLALGGTLLGERLQHLEETASLQPLPTPEPPSTAVPPATGQAEVMAEPTATGPAEVMAEPPTPLPTSTPLPEFVPAPGTRANVTPLQDFYVVDIATQDPDVAAARWHLVVKGLVDRPLSLAYEELLAYPRIDVPGTLQCISNEVGGSLISTARFHGLRLRDLLMQAGPQPGVVEVLTRSADGYTESIPFDKAMHPDTLLVYGMDGLTLDKTHGYPLRLFNPNHYGMKNPKWLQELELVATPYTGYWEQRGWDKTARIKTTSVVDTRSQLAVKDGVASLGGIAFAGWRGIQKVEVRIDDGEWRTAQLDQALSKFTWLRWRYDWHDPEPGGHTITVRAVDGDSVLQTERRVAPHPDGASGWHTVHVVVAQA